MTDAEYADHIREIRRDLGFPGEGQEAAVAVLVAALEACPDPALPRDPCDVASEEA